MHIGRAAGRLSKMADLATDKRRVTAVIFDMGGVLIPSIGKFLRAGTFYKTLVYCSDDSAYAKWERGEITMDEFGDQFSRECSQVAGKSVDMRRFPYDVDALTESGGGKHVTPFQVMIEASKRLRAAGIKTAVLTNNFAMSNGPVMPLDRSLYDCIIESTKVHMRKPERRIYEHTLRELNVDASNAVFLDDLDANVTGAQSVGITAIKVTSPEQGLRELQKLVDVDLPTNVDT